MGIFSKPKGPPPPPSPAEQAAAQQINQFGPQGNLIFGESDAEGNFTASGGQRSVTVEQTDFQRLLQQISEGLALNFGEQFAGDFGEQGFRGIPQDFSAESQKAEDAIFDSSLAKLQPQFDLQRSKLEQRLADQGIPIGSSTFDKEIKRLEDTQNDSIQQLSLQSVQAGQNRQTQLAQLAANQQAQQFGQIGSLLGFAQPFQPQNVQGVDLNANFASQLGAFNAQQQAQQSQASNLFGLGSLGAFAFSDRSLKENIKPAGVESGHNVYEFNYKGNDKKYIGVMADEVEKIMPEAVITKEGVRMVNYDMIGVDFREAA